MKLKRTWAALPQKDRMRWLVVVTAMVVGLYGLLLYPSSIKDLTKSKAMVARRLDRIERRARVPDVDAAAASRLQNRAAQLDRQRTDLETRLQAVAGRFITGSDPEARQTLLLELNTLAEATGIRLEKQGDELGRRGARELVDRESGRPYMHVVGAGDYWSLLAFLKGMGNLDYATAPLGLQLNLGGGERLSIKIDVAL